ncbi:unnamed protein product [Sphagnum troendelagicum]|uniref:AP2/ERF domain-containing protein n=2 Tax=Sphagnum TaxID=13804 RepID=A0ABP0V1H2_9BRYO
MDHWGESEWDSATSHRSNLRGKFKKSLRRLKSTRVKRCRGRKLGTACFSFRQRCQPGSSSRLSSDSPEAGKGPICRANEASDQSVVLRRLHSDDRGKRIDQLENNREEYCGEASYLAADADGTNPNSRVLERCGNREETANCSLVNQIVGCHDSPILHGSSASRGPGEEKINGIRQQNNKWVVEMRVAGKEKQHLLGFKRIWLGTYYTWDEAVRARDVGVFYCGKEPRHYFSPAYIPFLPSLETLSVSREPGKISARIKALAAKNSTKPDLGTSGAPPCSHLCHSCAAAQALQPQTISHTAHGLASLYQAQTEGFKHFQDVDQDRRAAGAIPQDQLDQAQRDMEQAQRAACAIPQDLEHVQRKMQDQARRAAYAIPPDLDHAQRGMVPTSQQALTNAKELDQYQNPLYGQRVNAQTLEDSTTAYNNVDGSNCVIPHFVARISDCTTAYNSVQKEAHGQSFGDHVFESDQMENGSVDCRLSPGLLETGWTKDHMQGFDQMQCFSPLWDELN